MKNRFFASISVRSLVVVQALVAAFLLAAVGCRGVAPEADSISQSHSPATQPPPVKVVYPNVPGSFVAVAKQVGPSVVNIFTAQIVRQNPFFGMPGLDELFGLPHRERIQRYLEESIR